MTNRSFRQLTIVHSLIFYFLFVTQSPARASVRLSEVLPKPSTGDEWIELENPDATTVSLSGYQLWDVLSQPSLLYSFTTEVIPAHSWLVIPIARKLNDSGDGVVLKNSAGSVIGETNYQTALADLSWSLLNAVQNSWAFSLPSAGSVNIQPTPTSVPTSTPTPTPTILITTTPTTTPHPTITLKPTSHSSVAASPTVSLMKKTSTVLPKITSDQRPTIQSKPALILTPTILLQPTATPTATSDKSLLTTDLKLWLNATMSSLCITSAAIVCLIVLS
jgi:hypothetical protein